VVNYLADLRAFLRWIEKTNGFSSPLDIDAAGVESYCTHLHNDKQRAASTVNRRLQTLRKFYNLAVDRGWTPANPAADVQLMTEATSRRSRSLTSKEVTRLLDVVRESDSRWADRDWGILQTLVGAGLKLSELTRLCVDDVHLEGTQPNIKVREASGEVNRSIPLAPEVREALRRCIVCRETVPGVEHVFVNRDGKPLSTRSVQRLLHNYAEKAGLDGLTSQALRYVYAREVYKHSGDVETVASLLGHRHLATTIRYLRPGSFRGK
jgi:integrase/recombinase XerC